MVKCSARGCSNSTFRKEGRSFHRFPRSADDRELWEAMAREETRQNKIRVICSDHFQKDDFLYTGPGIPRSFDGPNGKYFRTLKSGAVPKLKYREKKSVMNVARKSTTKLPQNWPPSRPKESETNSGLASADSTKDSFQEVLINIKALNGGSEVLDKPELNGTQKIKRDGNKNLAASMKGNGENSCDIQDQFDNIVNDSKTLEQGVENGVSKEDGATDVTGIRDSGADGEDEDEDDIVLIGEDGKSKVTDSSEKSLAKEKQTEDVSKGMTDADSKDRKNAMAKKKHPLQIGAKVRNTFHNIMSKLVQSGNPEVSSLITKTKSEDSQDSICSSVGDADVSPISVQHGKGNLFDNLDLDISDKDSRSPRAPLTKEGDDQSFSKKYQDAETSKEGQGKADGQNNRSVQNKEDVDSLSQGCATSKMETDSLQQEDRQILEKDLKSVCSVSHRTTVGDNVVDKAGSDAKNIGDKTDLDSGEVNGVIKDTRVKRKPVDILDMIDDPTCYDSDSMETTEEGDEEKVQRVKLKSADNSKSDASESNILDMVEKIPDEVRPSGDSSVASPVKTDLLVSESGVNKVNKSMSIEQSPDVKAEGAEPEVTSPIKDTTEPMDTTDKGDTNTETDQSSHVSATQCGDSVKLTDSERKRQHETGTDSDEALPKRSRLDEVIGKLGERVSIPSVTEENDSCDYDDSIPGDSESAEKQSEEISETASVSEEEEDGTPVSNSKTLRLTNKELEALVRTKVKAYMAQQQVAELRALRLRVVELQEAQEEWRLKAKDLERQVLDLTVLQQRLEKRKAHTAALRSITTRNFGVQVNEEKLRSNTPQKNAPAKTPPVTVGGSPVPTLTPPPHGQPLVVWSNNSQMVGQPLMSSCIAATTTTNKVTTITIGGNIGVRNTSVAQLLSQTARMPTAANSVTAASTTKSASGGGSNPVLKAPPPPLAVPSGRNLSLLETHAGGATTKVAVAAAPPASGIVLVNASSGLPVASKGVASTAVSGPTIIAAPPGATSTPSGIKIIDLTAEDDAGVAKLSGKPAGIPASQVRGIAPQQVVRQISPLPQGVPGTPSTILLSSAAGTQIIGAQNITRPPGMYQFVPGQVVTIANAQQLRPGALVTMLPGQPGLLRQAAPTTVSTVSRSPAPQILTQVPSGMTIVRPGAAVSTSVRPSQGPSVVTASAARMPVTVTTLQPPTSAVAQDSASNTVNKTVKSVHPAPPPPPVVRTVPGESKPEPPRPGLKISRVKQGIVLSWNMTLPSDCIEIASYQLYAYQETSAPPQTSLWKKVGDVKALPLPMACTLTQFQDGNKYHFAVRAVDIHGRTGNFSEPAFIFLSKSSS